jgi:hypothetical protein
MKITAVSIVYIIYAWLPNYAAVLFPLLPFVYGIKSNFQMNNRLFILLCFTVILMFYSVITITNRYEYNMISSAKLIFLLLFALLATKSPGLFYSSYKEFNNKYLTYGFAFVVFGIILYILIPDRRPLGMRGDVGVFVALFVFVVMAAVTYHCTAKNLIIFLLFMLLAMVFLYLLQGRTALGAFGICAFSGYWFGTIRREYATVNPVSLIMVIIGVILAVVGGLTLIVMRGGLEYILEAEARLLAILFWYDVVRETSFLNLLFGHGYGFCADTIADASDFVSAHVAQIKRSSGNDCYVSWGFHNTILSFSFEQGIMGCILLIGIIRASALNMGRYKNCFLFFIPALLIIISPNNHLLNNDLIGTLLMAFFAFSWQFKQRIIDA